MPWSMRHRAAAASVVFLVLVGMGPTDRVGVAQNGDQRDPETYHWVLPVDREGVEVAWLHPNDCYVIQQANGVAYFGEPPAAVLELQQQLPMPIAHPVHAPESHPECTLGVCVLVAETASAIEYALAVQVSRLLLRRVDHRPTPRDDWFGGAYADVGSDDRTTYHAAPDQLMLSEHLAASRRGNCFHAKVPRVLSVHVRDQQQHPERTGIYSGFLYIQHRHPSIVGKVIARRAGGMSPRLTRGDRSVIPRAHELLQIQTPM